MPDQLRTCREGLLDPQARFDERRRWADMLLSFKTPAARDMVVELLRTADRPEVRRALCSVLAEAAISHPERLDEAYIDPLVDLLESPDAETRTFSVHALADFPGEAVPARLIAVAADASASTAKRLAAIDALAAHTHRREVVEQLIALLDSGIPEITQHVLAVLAPITREDLGPDPARWRAWWKEQSKLGTEAWLAAQVRLYRDRARRLKDRLAEVQAKSRTEQQQLVERMQQFQRSLYRATAEDQQDALLARWLADPLPVVQETALTIIKTRIADEGRKPQGPVFSALLALLHDGTPQTRRAALEILQNLSDPAVVTEALAQLEKERDVATRTAIFKALGKLDSPQALPALIREIASPDSPGACVRQAALALGRIAPHAGDALPADRAVAALKDRYRRTDPSDAAMRAALLTAMAGVADEAFLPEFRSALEAEEPDILRAAIRGFLAVNDASRIRRLRTLMAHADPLVRLEAIRAVGRLGREEADLESLLTRMNPAIETDERARSAAFESFRQLLAKRPFPERIDAADRLRELPALQIRYLEALAEEMNKTDVDAAVRETLLNKLTTLLERTERFGECATHLRTLYELQRARKEAQTWATGLRLLHALLRSDPPAQVAAFTKELAETAADDDAKARIRKTVEGFLLDARAVNDPARSRQLVEQLRKTVPASLLGPEWTSLLDRAAAGLTRNDNAASTPGS
ncbi:MAG: hypothetical protein D6788_01315 [Planctomycetota bacterium]|nr:MAG: hypothetical protein D6788_01315 [Planctomycetota bacterium]